MDWPYILIDQLFGFFELILALAFLLLSYKFSKLARHYKVEAFRDLSFGFRFLFVSYFLPIMGAYLGNVIHGDSDFDIQLLYVNGSYVLATSIALFFFFRAVASVVRYANSEEA